MKEIFISKHIQFINGDDWLDDSNDMSSSDDECSNKDYEWVKSSTSFSISEIKSLIFGGFSSRFWLFRKYMNSCHCKHLKS